MAEEAGLIIEEWMSVLDDGRMRLRGRQCEQCGRILFPPPVRCTACGAAGLVEAPLGPDAVLFSFTVDRLGGFLRRPHLVGQAKFDDGPVVQGYVDAEIDTPPSVGSPVELVPFGVRDGDAEFVTYAFRRRGR